ncbi:Aluminum-activated malate transporter 8 [Vitis vinifera]|uniref:Aluminum-activated malate transporter 8 n=1 Tax=Vitis vinifera TaxID=29760 RepID=A0A438GM12_VITVI|nr:Aluminum-activated malate transporter 8 [Vitis vinifera]
MHKDKFRIGRSSESLSLSNQNNDRPSSADPHVANAKAAVKDLEIALNAASLDETDLLEIIPDATVASILIEIVKCMEKVSESVHELSGLAHFKVVEPNVTPEKPQLLHRGTIQPIPDGDATDVIITIDEASSVSPENDKGPSKGKQDESHVNMC